MKLAAKAFAARLEAQLDLIGKAQTLLSTTQREDSSMSQVETALWPILGAKVPLPPQLQRVVVARLLRLLVATIKGPKGETTAEILAMALNRRSAARRSSSSTGTSAVPTPRSPARSGCWRASAWERSKWPRAPGALCRPSAPS